GWGGRAAARGAPWQRAGRAPWGARAPPPDRPLRPGGARREARSRAAPCARRWRGTRDRLDGRGSRAASSPEQGTASRETLRDHLGDALLHSLDLLAHHLLLLVPAPVDP